MIDLTGYTIKCIHVGRCLYAGISAKDKKIGLSYAWKKELKENEKQALRYIDIVLGHEMSHAEFPFNRKEYPKRNGNYYFVSWCAEIYCDINGMFMTKATKEELIQSLEYRKESYGRECGRLNRKRYPTFVKRMEFANKYLCGDYCIASNVARAVRCTDEKLINELKLFFESQLDRKRIAYNEKGMG